MEDSVILISPKKSFCTLLLLHTKGMQIKNFCLPVESLSILHTAFPRKMEE